MDCWGVESCTIELLGEVMGGLWRRERGRESVCRGKWRVTDGAAVGRIGGFVGRGVCI